MPGKTEHILLCNFDFPPNQGIGGRRWAKLARGLAEEGFIVHVIKAKPVKGNVPSPWTDEIQHPNIRVTELPRKYPEIILKTGRDIWSRFRFQLAKLLLKRKEKGTIYDVAIGWEESFNAKAYKLITEFRIQNVIATGAPWNLLLYAARLKKQFPTVHLISDYRDPWLTARNYGMPQLSDSRKRVEKEKQLYVLSKSDLVICPNEFLLEEIRGSHKGESVRFPHMEVLAHSYDPSDCKDVSPVKRNDNKIVFVYGGALYVEMEEHLIAFRKYLYTIRDHNRALFDRFEFRIFTDNQKEAEPFRQFSNVHVSMPVGKNIFEEIRSADFCLMLLSHHNRNFKTTKYYEYLPFRKPFVFIGEKGLTTALVEQNKLGYSIENYENDFKRITSDFDNGKLNFDPTFDISSYSLKTRVGELISFLKR